MKVLMVAPSGYPMSGGVEKHIHELAKSLIKAGSHVEVLTHKSDATSEGESREFDGVKYTYFKPPMNNFYLVSEGLIRYIKYNHKAFDIVHLQALHKPLSMYVIMRTLKHKLKFVLTPHYHGGGHTLVASIAHLVYRYVVKAFIGKVDKVIAVSDGEADILRSHFKSIKNKIVVIPNGIVTPLNSEPFKKDKPVLLSVSRIEPYKRIDKIIEKLPEDLKLVVVGSGNDLRRLKQLAVNKDVVFTEGISDEELGKWWHTADAFISLSEKEAYGLTFGEAMSIGLPCIVSDIPAHRFVHKVSGSPLNVVFYGHNQDFMRQYKKATADIKDSRTVSVFTWDKATMALTAIYEDVA